MRVLRIIWKIGQRYYKKSIYANFSAKKIHTAIYFANISWSAAGSWLPRNVVYVVFLIKNVNSYCLSSTLFLSHHLSWRYPEDTPKIEGRNMAHFSLILAWYFNIFLTKHSTSTLSHYTAILIWITVNNITTIFLRFFLHISKKSCTFAGGIENIRQIRNFPIQIYHVPHTCT